MNTLRGAMISLCGLMVWPAVAGTVQLTPQITLNTPKVWKLADNGQIRTWITIESSPMKELAVERILHPAAGNFSGAVSKPSYRSGWSATYNNLQNAFAFRRELQGFDSNLSFLDLAKFTFDEITLAARDAKRVEISQAPSQPTDAIEVVAEQQTFAVVFNYQASRGGKPGPSGKFPMAQMGYISPNFATRTVSLKAEETEFSLLSAKPGVPLQQAEGICLVTPSGYVPVPQNLIRQLQLTVRCPNMFEARMAAINPTNRSIEIAVLPGTIFKSKDEEFQHMLVVGEARLVLPARSRFGPSLDAFFDQDRTEAKVATHCLNFRKHIPNETKEYEIVTGMPVKLLRIARFESGFNQRGPWDQLRTWLYSDQVTLDEAQRALNPAPGEGMYVSETANMFQTTQEDPSRPEYNKLFDSKLLNGHTNSIANALWYINQLAKDKPEDLALWLGGENKVEAMIGDNREAVQTYVASVMNHVFSQPNKEIRLAALKLLGDKLPASTLAKLDANGGLQGAYASMQGTDATEAAIAVRIARKVGSKNAMFSAFNVNAKLPKSVRDEAAKLAAQKP